MSRPLRGDRPEPDGTDRADALAFLGGLRPKGLQWLEACQDADAILRLIRSEESAKSRFLTLLRDAPVLVEDLAKHEGLTAEIVGRGVVGGIQLDLSNAADLHEVANRFSRERLRMAAGYALGAEPDFGAMLTDLTDLLLRHCRTRLYGEFEIVALGSYGRREMAWNSDADILCLAPPGLDKEMAKTQVQDFLMQVTQIGRYGAAMRLDPSRVRGVEVWTYEEFQAHDLASMDMWERFMLGDARLVVGSEAARDLAIKVGYAQPLTPERFQNLMEAKKRLESEEVAPRYLKRDIKHGHGSLDDIDWFVHVLEMRYPTATKAGTNFGMSERIRELARAQLINAVEAEVLLEARAYLLDLRNKLDLLGVERSVLPENPDKLERLAAQIGEEDGNALLRRHENLVRTVRSIFSEGLERLKL